MRRIGMFGLGWWVLIVMLIAGGCSREEESGQDSGEVEAPKSREEVLRSELDWGEYAGHPMEEALEDCLFLGQDNLILLHRLIRGEELSDEAVLALGELVGVEISEADDEFSRERQREEFEERLLEEIQEFIGRSYCVEFDLYLDEYDFQGERLQVARRGAWKIYRDIVSHRPYQRYGNVLPDEYLPPLALKLRGLDGALSMSPEDAEEFLGGLVRVEEFVEEEEVADDQEEYFTKAPTMLLPAAAREALSLEEFALLYDYEGDAQELVAAVESYFQPPEGARVVSAVAVFAIRDERGGEDWTISRGGEEIRLGQVQGQVEQLLILDGNAKRVAHVWPKAGEGHQGARVAPVDPDPESHQALMDALCGGNAVEFSEPRVVDGELSEIISYGCERCPGELRSRSGTLKVDFITQGSFSGAGVEEALVHSRGCGYRRTMGPGVMSYLRRELGGEWRLLEHQPFLWSTCEFFETSLGTSLPVCTQVAMGEDIFISRNRALILRGSDIKVEALFETGSNFHGCGSTYAGVRVDSVSVGQGVEDAEELRFVVDVTTGATVDGSPHCYGESEVEEEEERLEFGLKINREGLETTPGASRALQQLEGLL